MNAPRPDPLSPPFCLTSVALCSWSLFSVGWLSSFMVFFFFLHLFLSPTSLTMALKTEKTDRLICFTWTFAPVQQELPCSFEIS